MDYRKYMLEKPNFGVEYKGHFFKMENGVYSMPCQCQRKKLLVIMVFLCFITLFFMPGCFGEKNFQYLAYMDTGEGTYLLLRLELTHTQTDNYLYCLADGALGAVNYDVADGLRGCDMPSEHLTKNDITKIRHAFNISKPAKLALKKNQISNSKVSFITEQKQIEDGLIAKLEFNGIKRGTVILGKLLIHYSNLKYPQSMEVEFIQIK